ncbi:Multidrug resistance protein MdtG [Candidatus Tiddalikarchaeum anstoanum]|nr:Multidrug resistance protein MdtG [Candidatus Tiddalikarchaeum anstoanum]
MIKKINHDKIHPKKHEIHNNTTNIKMSKDLRNLVLINSFYNFFYGLAEPFITIFFNKFGDLSEVGISIAILYIVQGVISYFVSNYINVLGPKRVVLISQIFESVRVFGFIFAQNVYWVYGLQILGGIIQGFNTPAYMSVYVNVCRDESDKSVGIHSSIPTIAYGVSALIAGFMIDMFGYVPIFILWGLQELFYGLYIYFKV